MTKHLTILLIIIFAAAGLRAQTKVYPIQVTISGSSDISPELSELYGIKSTLMFTFQCLDRKETNLPVAVKVRLYPASAYGKAIENTLQTGRKTFDIGFGQTIIEQKGDLEKYFLNEYTNLSQAGYYQNGQLAEGNYILQVVCYDARTISRQISNVAKIYLHIDQFNYPTLLFPRNNTDLEQYTTKPTISFQWTYYGKTDTKIRYRFELWEVINPTTVETYVKQTKPIFTEEDLFVTQKSYMPELLNLKIGQKYCWRVTAYDPDHKLPFKRGGESDVYQFQYLNPPVLVTGLANKVTGKQIKYTWNADRNHTKYYVEYYDYKRDTTISSSQQDNTVTLTAPEYDYRIKFRVRAECYNDPARVSEYTPWSEAYVQPEKKIDFECGKQFPDREIANQELKTTFFEGEIVESKNGDSRYEIIKATARPDGSLDGKFYAIMDCWSGAKILCDFWDTKINTDNIILTTRYRSEDIPGFVADPEEIKKYAHELVNNAHMAATDNKIRDTILINQKFDYLYTENGRLMAVVVDNNGEPQVTDVTPDKPYSQSLITDGQGDTLVVSKKGQVMGVKEYKFAGDDRHLLNEYHRQLDSLGEWQINFTPDTKHQTYAFDYLGSGNHGIFATDEYYPRSGDYDFRYKSVESGKTDKVKVEFGAYPQADSVVFKDKYGVTYPINLKTRILTFTGVSKADTNYIYAYRGDKKIGKLFLNTYQKKTYNVVLVSVNEAKILHEKNVDKAVKKVEESLNKVYNQCAVSFKITHAAIFIDDLTSFSHGGSGILTVYNDNQKKVLKAYDSQMQDGVYYLFFIDNVTDKKDGNGTSVSGYMPRGYNAGFIYDGGSEHTIAHELGHGVAGLEHVFENSQSSGKTNNLMDYASGEELWHFQWDQIQDPSRLWMKWSKDESEGEWTTDGHYYLFTYLGMLMGMEPTTAEQYGKWAEEPDSRVFNAGDMEENITWLIGGLQQRNHALTGGCHGVELATTAYTITHYLTNDNKTYLFHRFGDCYAHLNNSNDSKGFNTTVRLQSYIDAFEDYLNSTFSFVRANTEQRMSDRKTITIQPNKIIYDNNKYITSIPRDKFIQMLLRKILTADSEGGLESEYKSAFRFKYVTYSGFDSYWQKYIYKDDYEYEYSDIISDLKKYLPQAVQNSYEMYGADQDGPIDSWCTMNFGHVYDMMNIKKPDIILPEVIIKKANSPDAIVRRRKLFSLYTHHLFQLLSMINEVDGFNERDACNRIDGIVEWASKKDLKDARFDGIFAFEIMCVNKNIDPTNAHGKEILIPIKYIREEVKQSDFTARINYYKDHVFMDDANKQYDYLKDYLKDVYNLVCTQQVSNNGRNIIVKIQ